MDPPKPEGVIIGLTGPAGCGKSTVASYLKVSYDFEEISFADPIKRVCSELFNLPLSVFHDRYKKEIKIERYGGKSPRDLLQWFGTDIMRTFDDQFWLKRAFWQTNDLLEQKGPFTNIVFSDVRFTNEAEGILQFSRHALIQIVPGEHLPSRLSATAASHVSENGIPSDLITHVVKNDSTLDALYTKINTICNGL